LLGKVLCRPFRAKYPLLLRSPGRCPRCYTQVDATRFVP
jgi:hypothetical protein